MRAIANEADASARGPTRTRARERTVYYLSTCSDTVCFGNSRGVALLTPCLLGFFSSNY